MPPAEPDIRTDTTSGSSGADTGAPAPDRVCEAIGSPLDIENVGADNRLSRRSRLAGLGHILLFGLLCGTAGWAGLVLADWVGDGAPLLPASGVAVAGLVIGGLRLWPAVLLSGVTVTVLAALEAGQDPATLSSVVIIAGGFMGPMLGAALLRTGLHRHGPAGATPVGGPLDRPFAAWQALFLGVVLPAAVVAATGVIGVVLDGVLAAEAIPRAVWKWFRTEAAGLLLFVLPALAVAAAIQRGQARREAAADVAGNIGAEPRDSSTSGLEGLAAAGLAAVLLFIGFSPWLSLPGFDPALLLAGPVVWAALRVSQPAALLLAAAVGLAMLAGTLAGQGPFVRFDGTVLALPWQAVVTLLMVLAALSSAGRRLQAAREAAAAAEILHLHADKEQTERTVAQRDRAIRRLRETLEETRVEAVAGEDLQAGVLGAVAREMAAAAAALRAAIDRVLRVQRPDRPMPEGLNAASQAADVLGALAGDVGDIAAMEADTLHPNLAPTDLTELVETVAARLAERRPGRPVSFVDPTMPRELSCDGGRLRQILATAADACLRLSERDPVTLRALMEEGRPGDVAVRLDVTTAALFPDGPGARPMTLGAFLDVAGAAPIGSGRAALSLWLARRLVEIMDGEADIRSWPEQGSTISARLTLPRPAGSGHHPLDLPDLSPVRVLVVEGSRAQADVLHRYLTARGAQVEVLATAAEGLARLRLGERADEGGGAGIDVVLIDASLRLVHGRTLLDRLLDGVPPGVRVIALHPPGTAAWRPPGKPGTVTAVLDRPVRRAALFAAVAKASGVDRPRRAAAATGIGRPAARGALPSAAVSDGIGRKSAMHSAPVPAMDAPAGPAETDPIGPNPAATLPASVASEADRREPVLGPAQRPSEHDWEPTGAVRPLADPVTAAYLRGARGLLGDLETAATRRDPRAVRAIARTLRENGMAVGAESMAGAAKAIETAAAEPDWPAVGIATDALRAALVAAEEG